MPGPTDIRNTYMQAQDSGPGAYVWASARGALVANNDASFLVWLAGGVATDMPNPIQCGATGTTLNNAGAIQVPCDTTANLTTGQRVYYTGASSGVAAAFAINVDDATHFTLTGSIFSVADTGPSVVGATLFATAAEIYAAIDNYNQSLWSGGQFNGLHTQSAGGVSNVTLTNPMKLAQNLSAGGGRVILPKMNVPNSIPIGSPIYFFNSGNIASQYTLYYQDGVTQVDGNIIGGGGPAVGIGYILTDNSTQNGTLKKVAEAANTQWPVTWGGTSQGSLTANAVLLGQDVSPVGFATVGTAGRVLIDQGAGADPGFKVISGDATLAAAGGLTLASTITAGGPTGDATHVAQITYDAKGRLTAVSSIAIDAGSLSGGAALTKTDDTNVTLTLGGTPTTALLKATSITVGWSGTLAVSRGGTGAATLTAHGVLLGEGTSAIAATAAMTNGQLLVGQTSSDPLPKTVSGDATMAASGALTVTGINGVDQTAAWSTYTPTVSVFSGSLTSASATGRYRQIGKTVIVEIDVTVTDAGTGVAIIATLPVTAAANKYILAGRDVATGKAFTGYIRSAVSTNAVTSFYDNSNTCVTGAELVMTGVYEAA